MQECKEQIGPTPYYYYHYYQKDDAADDEEEGQMMSTLHVVEEIVTGTLKLASNKTGAVSIHTSNSKLGKNMYIMFPCLVLIQFAICM